MKNIKYVVIHSHGNTETAHGYYQIVEEAYKSLDKLSEEEIESKHDNIRVYRVDVDKIEAENDASLEDLDMYDVAYESELIKEFSVMVSWYWEEVAE